MSRSQLRRRRNIFPYLVIAPTTLYLLIFTVLPLLNEVHLSFTNAELVNPNGGDAVGLNNYARLLGSEKFWNSLLITLLYTLITVLFAVGLGSVGAILMNTKFKGLALVRALVTVPWAIPTVASALIFGWIYDSESGVLNKATQLLGLGRHGWLDHTQTALLSVLVATIWAVFPIVLLVVLASLQSVPRELQEATWLDGAGSFQSFRAVTLPHIMPTVAIMTLLMTIWSIRRFEIIYLLTGGGPLDSTNTLVVNVYRTAFQNQQLGRAAAIGVLGLLLSLVITVIYFAIERRQSKKDEA